MDIIERLQVRVRARAGNILYPGEPGIHDPLLADVIVEIERLRAIIASFAGCGKTTDCANLGSDACVDDCGHAAEHYKGPRGM